MRVSEHFGLVRRQPHLDFVDVDVVELPYKLKPGIGAKNNFIAAFQMVNEGIAKRVGRERKRAEWSTEEFTAAMNLLPEILDSLVREVKKVQNAEG